MAPPTTMFSPLALRSSLVSAMRNSKAVSSKTKRILLAWMAKKDARKMCTPEATVPKVDGKHGNESALHVLAEN